MSTDRRLLAGVLGLGLLVAACGGSSSAGASSEPGASSAPAATGSAAPSTADAAATGEPAATDSAAPSDSAAEPALSAGAVADLESMLPSKVGAFVFKKESVNWQEASNMGSASDTAQAKEMLAKYGRTLSDMSMATASSTIQTKASSTGYEMAFVAAIRMRGVPANQWGPDLLSQPGAAEVGVLKDTVLGGKSVRTNTPEKGQYAFVFYFKDDVMFELTGPDANLAELVAALP